MGESAELREDGSREKPTRVKNECKAGSYGHQLNAPPGASSCPRGHEHGICSSAALQRLARPGPTPSRCPRSDCCPFHSLTPGPPGSVSRTRAHSMSPHARHKSGSTAPSQEGLSAPGALVKLPESPAPRKFPELLPGKKAYHRSRCQKCRSHTPRQSPNLVFKKCKICLLKECLLPLTRFYY